MEIVKTHDPNQIIEENTKAIEQLVKTCKDPIVRKRLKEAKNRSGKRRLDELYNILVFLYINKKLSFSRLDIFLNSDTRIPLDQFSDYFLEELIKAMASLDIEKINKILVLHGYFEKDYDGRFIVFKEPIDDDKLTSMYLDKCSDDVRPIYERVVKSVSEHILNPRTTVSEMDDIVKKFELIFEEKAIIFPYHEQDMVERLIDKYKKRLRRVLKKQRKRKIHKTAIIKDVNDFMKTVERNQLRKLGLYLPIAFTLVYVGLSPIYNLFSTLLLGSAWLFTTVIGLSKYFNRRDILIKEIKRSLGQFVDFL